MIESQDHDRAFGAMLGTFVGDALGVPWEGAAPEAIPRRREMDDARLGAGTYTDDTEMMIAVAESLVRCDVIDEDPRRLVRGGGHHPRAVLRIWPVDPRAFMGGRPTLRSRERHVLEHRMTIPMLQIGEVADRVGLSLRTVRYYEEMGLIEPEDRTEGGFRLYTEVHVERLELIKQMKPLGFSVQEIRQLLEANDALAADDVASDAQDAARETLRGFAATVAERCDEMRDRLTHAEEFGKELRRKTRRPRTPAARS